MGIDGLHRVEVLQVPGQVVLGGERRRPQLVAAGRGDGVGTGIDIGICAGIGIGVARVVVVVVLQGGQGVSVGLGTGIRLTVSKAMAMPVAAMSELLVLVVCRHGVPRARQHPGRARSGGGLGLDSLQAFYQVKAENGASRR